MRTIFNAWGLAGPPSASSASANRVDVFAVGPDANVWRWSRDGAMWTPPLMLPPNGQIPSAGLCAISSGPDQVEVFAISNSANPVWWRGIGTDWSSGTNLPGPSNIPAVAPAAVAASPDDIDVFAVGTDGLIWWWHWNGISWTAAAPLSVGVSFPAARIAAVSPEPGRMDVFAAGADTHLWHCWKTSASGWNVEDLGGDLPAVGVSAVSWGPGRIDVFAVSRLAGFPLLHWWRDGGAFSAPEPRGGGLAQVAVSAVSYAPNRLNVFAIAGDRDRQLVQWHWDGGQWYGPDPRGENIPAGDVSAVARPPHRLDVFVVGDGNSLLQWPGGGVENRRNQSWQNWPTTFETPAFPGIVRPGSLEELVNIVSEAERANLGVRAVGTGWSSSDVAVSSGYVVETDLLGTVLTHVLPSSLNAEGAAMRLLHLEAGMKLDRLVAILQRLGWELKTLGGSTGQSLAGAMSTSSHGMDPSMGPLPDMVRAIHLIGPGGIQHWIEPASRIITERAALRATLGIADENIHYDDDWFNSVLVSMGGMGIFYSMVIEFDERYDLEETRGRFTWAEMREQLLANDSTNPFWGTSNGVQVVISPFANSDGSRNSYLTTRRREVASSAAPAQPPLWLLILANIPAVVGGLDNLIISITEDQQVPGIKRGLAHSLSGDAYTPPLRGIGLELIFDASTPAYLNFVDDALEIIRAAYAGSPQQWPFLGWISLRFQGRSGAYLSPQYGADLSCSVEFAAGYRIPGVGPSWLAGTPDLFAMIEQAGRRRGGIQHWGMNASIDAGDVDRKYRRLDTWRRVRWELTRGGTLKTFDSEFTRRCGLSAPPTFVRGFRYNFGNERTDAAFWRPSTGEWTTLSATGTERIELWGEVGDIPVPADFDGDGITDLAVWRPSSGMWLVVESSRPAVTQPVQPPRNVVGVPGGVVRPPFPLPADSATTIGPVPISPADRSRAQQWGQIGDVPVTGNFNGEGRSDFAVWRPATGEWFVKSSATGTELVRQWGQPGDIPLAGDYFGHGRSDFVIWRPATGVWWVLNSDTLEVRVVQWGQDGDVPVPGDYSGDGRFDFAVWRPASGTWFIKDNLTGSETAQQWGDSRDVPVPRDYTGEGRFDFAVWRPSTGVLYIKNSATGAERNLLYGRFGDVPL